MSSVLVKRRGLALFPAHLTLNPCSYSLTAYPCSLLTLAALAGDLIA